jgi:V-type H+-transporting ATPase 16kDa proteolipid subunit
MAGIVAIYGLVVSVMIVNNLEEKNALHTNFLQLGAGLSVGISGLASGMSIGIIGDAGVRGAAQQPKMYMGMVMILIFAEVLGECDLRGEEGVYGVLMGEIGLYGAIVAILMLARSTTGVTKCY